jgi:hypothetical protein
MLCDHAGLIRLANAWRSLARSPAQSSGSMPP